MNDRELLELAAKAAGIEYRPDSGYRVTGTGVTGIPIFEKWNPLTDDGDALRLAVDLGLNVYPLARTETGQACSAVGTGSRGRLSEVIDPNDTSAATRRAIVRAAAAIGKAMQ